MRALNSHGLLGAIAVATLGLGGCATEEYVDMQVAGVQSQVTTHTGQISALEGRVSGHDSQLTKLDGDNQATAKLAAGKFNFTKVGEETILFDTAKFRLSDEQTAKVVDLANRLKSEDKNRYIEIEGFADKRGENLQNRVLALGRAYMVFDLLRDNGVNLNRMSVISHGEFNQTATDNSPETLAQNRRVIITVVE